MKSFLSLIALTVCVLPVAAHADTIVNLNATNSGLTPLALNAGTYQVAVIGTTQGGAYNGWNYATQNFGTSLAAPAPNSWTEKFTLSIGGTSTTYNLLSANNASATQANALSAFQSSVLYTDSGVAANSNLTVNSAIFTIASAQTVNFSIPDNFFVDNWGGVSLNVSQVSPASATPEPSTFGLMGLMLAGGVATFRCKMAR